MRPCVPALVVLAVLSGSVRGDVVAIGADRDNTIFNDPGPPLSNGGDPGIFAGRTALGPTRRALIRFDVAGAVPAGSVITSVQLRLHMSMTIIGEREITLHRLLADWGEGVATGNGAGNLAQPGDATWNHRFHNTVPWALPGGDFAAGPSASAPVDQIGFYSWGSTTLLVADAQSWLDQPGANFGWLIMGDESDFPSAKRFDSRENPLADVRPRLTIEYTPIPGPGAIATLAIAGTLSARRRR